MNGSNKRHKQAARAIQAECGVRYTTALAFVQKHHDEIVGMVSRDGAPDWREYAEAAAGLWRRKNGERR